MREEPKKKLPASMVVNRYDQSLDQHCYPFDNVGTVRIDNEVVAVLGEKGREGVLAMANILHSQVRDLVANYAKKQTMTERIRRENVLEAVPQWTHTVEDLAFNLFKTDPRVIEFAERVAEAPKFNGVERLAEIIRERKAKLNPMYEKMWARGKTLPMKESEAKWVSEAYERAHQLDAALCAQRVERKVR